MIHAAPAAQGVLADLETALAEYLRPRDEEGLDGAWTRAQQKVAQLALRPAKRIRPRLLLLGHRLARGPVEAEPALMQFAAALEILHAFLLIHDDVADRADLRRGGPTLHRMLGEGRLGEGRLGEDLAIVAGDHLFARAMELMVTSPVEGAARATAFVLAVCRHTAVGQYLDLVLSRRPLAEVTPFEALRVARLKTADYSFAAPLQCGALLAGANEDLFAALRRLGRAAGLAFQLRDDLLGIFGDESLAGKSGYADLVEAKRTLPLVIAHRRSSAADRAFLESLHVDPSPRNIARAREIVRNAGGATLTLRLIDRYTASARRTLDSLDRVDADAARTLSHLLIELTRRRT